MVRSTVRRAKYVDALPLTAALGPDYRLPVMGVGYAEGVTPEQISAYGRQFNGVGKSADYGFVLADANKLFLHPAADTTPRTWTIPANESVAFPLFTTLTLINQNGAGTITIAITSDTMRLAGSGSTGSRSLAANGMATAVKVAATEWLINGTGLS